jgi:hypothetical protein
LSAARKTKIVSVEWHNKHMAGTAVHNGRKPE